MNAHSSLARILYENSPGSTLSWARYRLKDPSGADKRLVEAAMLLRQLGDAGYVLRSRSIASFDFLLVCLMAASGAICAGVAIFLFTVASHLPAWLVCKLT